MDKRNNVLKHYRNQSKHRKNVIKVQYILILILLSLTVFSVQHKEVKTVVKKVQLSDAEIRQRYLLLCNKEMNSIDTKSVLTYTRNHKIK